MALVTKQKKDFSLRIKDPNIHGENVVFIRGGSVIIQDKWVFFPDMRIDVQQVVLDYVGETSRRLFNNYNDIIYVLIVLNKSTQIEVIPNASYKQNSFGDVKIFSSLSGKLPLILVKLTQDGSTDLKSFNPIQPSDIELYQGYGNYTVMGDKGEEGPKGVTGGMGYTGIRGVIGRHGASGKMGETGAEGVSLRGITGADGPDGVDAPAYIPER